MRKRAPSFGNDPAPFAAPTAVIATVGNAAVRREPLRLKAKARLGALQHGPRGANLSLANGA